MKKGGKRGDVAPQALFFLFEVLLVLVVLVALLSRVDSIRKNTDFEKAYIARDSALLLNTLFILPGNAFYVYSIPSLELKKFDISFQNNLVGVKEAEQKAAQSKYFPYAENKFLYQNLGSVSAEKELFFLKSGNYIKTEKSSNLDKIYFIPKSYSLENQRILIYPPNGSNDDVTNKIFVIANSIKSNMAQKPDLIRLTRESVDTPDYPSSRQNLIAEAFKPYAIITITIGSYISDKNYIKAYYSINNPKKEEAKQLADYILNEISEQVSKNGNISGLAIVPTDPDLLQANSPMAILKDDRISLVFEIGNIQSDLGKKMLSSNIGDIGLAFANGINKHFAQKP